MAKAVFGRLVKVPPRQAAVGLLAGNDGLIKLSVFAGLVDVLTTEFFWYCRSTLPTLNKGYGLPLLTVEYINYLYLLGL